MMSSSSNSCSKCGYTTRYESLQMHTLPCRHNVCEFCLKDIPGLLDGHILSCPDCGSCFQYVRPLEEIDGEAGNTHSHEKRTGTGKDYIAVSENEKNEAIEEMSSQGWGRRYDHHSGKLTSASSQNAPKVSQQKEHAHVANRVNVSGNDYSQNPARVGHTNHDYGQPANHGYYQELPAKWSTESYHERGTSARSPESGDLFRLEESSRRTPTIHIEDKDDGRGSTYCSEHNKPVYFFCLTCDVLICAACSEGEHKSHGATKIDDSPDKVNHDNNQVGSEVQHVNPETPPKCLYHDRPCIMVCKYKLEYICKDCNQRYHSTCVWSDHISLRSAGTALLRKSKDFEWKMKSVESKKEKATETGKSNIETIMTETEALKMKINIATEKAKERLDAYKNDVVAKIDKVAGEKIYSCTTAVESLNSVTGFLQQARQMDMEFQQDAERGQYLKAMRSVRQIEDVIDNIDKTVIQNNIKEDKLGLQVREESFRDPFKVTRDGLWSSIF